MYGRASAAGPLQPKPNVAVDPVYPASRREWLRRQADPALAAGARWVVRHSRRADARAKGTGMSGPTGQNVSDTLLSNGAVALIGVRLLIAPPVARAARPPPPPRAAPGGGG